MLQRYKDAWIGGFLLLFSAAYYLEATTFGTAGQFVGPQMIPMIIGLLMMVLSLLLIGSGIYKGRKEVKTTPKNEPVPDTEVSNYKKVVLTLVFIAFFMFTLDITGFLIASFLYLVMQITLIAPKEERKPLPILLVSAGFTVFIYVLFTQLFSIQLPRGFLPF